MTAFWITLLIGLPLGGGVLGLRAALGNRRIDDINREAEKDNE